MINQEYKQPALKKIRQLFHIACQEIRGDAIIIFAMQRITPSYK